MKKFLVTGGVLFSVLPAMALELPTNLIEGGDSVSCSATQSPEFAVAHGELNPLQMQALYVRNTCSAGQYLSVDTEQALTIGNDGTISNASCTTCPAGSYCEGLSDITITNNQLESSYGMSTCPTGYTDGGTGVTSQANCAKTVDASYCASLNLCNNFNNIVTTGNNACSTSVNSNNSSIVNGVVTFGNRGTEPLCTVNKTCQPGYTTTNLYAWLVTHPEAFSANYSSCSPDGTSAGCTTMEPGTVTFTFIGAGRPINEAHFVITCTNREADYSDFSTLVVDQATANFDITTPTGGNMWMKAVDYPNQPWLYGGNFGSVGTCMSSGFALTPANSTYLFGEMQNGEFVLSNAGQNTMALFSMLAPATNGQNGNPTADVCIASEITINWADVQDAGSAGTCTYGEDFTAPAAPTKANHKFLGWKVSVSE